MRLHCGAGNCCAGACWPHAASAAKLADVIHDVQQRSVKIYGAGGLHGLDAYQSGFLISAQGHIVTVFSHVLDSEVVTVIFDDGRKFEAQMLGADPRLEVAVLKIEAADLPFFDLHKAATGIGRRRRAGLQQFVRHGHGGRTGERAAWNDFGRYAAGRPPRCL